MSKFVCTQMNEAYTVAIANKQMFFGFFFFYWVLHLNILAKSMSDVPASSAWFAVLVQIHVFISNKANSHCDKYRSCSDALIQSLASCQRSQQTGLSNRPPPSLCAALSPSHKDKRPHRCHPTAAAIDYDRSCLTLPSPYTLLIPHLICFLHPLFPYWLECRVAKSWCLYCSLVFLL